MNGHKNCQTKFRSFVDSTLEHFAETKFSPVTTMLYNLLALQAFSSTTEIILLQGVTGSDCDIVHSWDFQDHHSWDCPWVPA